MAIPYELICEEDLNLGIATDVEVTNPAGSTMTGSQVGLHTFVGNAINVDQADAAGDCTEADPHAGTDDYGAIQDAIDALPDTGGVVSLSPGKIYRCTATIDVDKPVHFLGWGARIVQDFDTTTSTADGELFNVTVSKVTFEGVSFDNTNITGITDATGNRYVVKVTGTSDAHLSNVHLVRCSFKTLNTQANKQTSSPLGHHCIYMSYVDNFSIKDCYAYDVTGAFVFLNDCSYGSITDNECNLVEWYPIHLDHGNTAITISRNKIYGNTSTGSREVFWGGGIDVMSQTTNSGTNDDRIIITDNYLAGVYRYGAAIRLTSVRGGIVRGNIFDQCDTNVLAGDSSSLIAVTVRDVTSDNNGPSNNITIDSNIAYAAGTKQRFVYASTSSGTANNTTAARGLYITNNQVYSVDASNFFVALAQIQGSNAGWTDIVIAGNTADGTPISDDWTLNFAGMICIITGTGKHIAHVTIHGNHLAQYGSDGTDSDSTGIYIGTDIQKVRITNNQLRGFFRGIWVDGSNDELMAFPEGNYITVASGGDGVYFKGVGDSGVEFTDLNYLE